MGFSAGTIAILQGVGLGAAAGVGIAAASGAFSPKAPSTAPLEKAIAAPPPVMPTADDAAVKTARRRSLAEQAIRRGRASTILTNTSDLTGDVLG